MDTNLSMFPRQLRRYCLTKCVTNLPSLFLTGDSLVQLCVPNKIVTEGEYIYILEKKKLKQQYCTFDEAFLDFLGIYGAFLCRFLFFLGTTVALIFGIWQETRSLLVREQEANLAIQVKKRGIQNSVHEGGYVFQFKCAR